MLIKIDKGLDIPLGKTTVQQIEDADTVSRAASVAYGFHGLKPGMAVAIGDRVTVGQTLFTDKRNSDVCYPAPVSGIVREINRGERRLLHSVVIELQPAPTPEYESFTNDEITKLSDDKIVRHLLDSGLWIGFKTRPYSKVPNPGTRPHSIFVTAMDTRPLAIDPIMVIRQAESLFAVGVQVLSQMTSGQVFVCTSEQARLTLPQKDTVRQVRFAGPHPVGLVGTHIHYLDPIVGDKVVWSIGYQDVIAIGKLFSQGNLSFERIISLGSTMQQPRLLRTHVGASISELCGSVIALDNCRVIAGSVLEGWRASGALDFLGYSTLQITLLEEYCESSVLGWLKPLRNTFSLSKAVTWLGKQSKFIFNCRQNGSPRAFVPLGLYEYVMPLEILPAPLLKSLLVMDTDMAQKLGCLELDEEDLALCSYVCPSKHEFGWMLRSTLEQIEKEG